MKDCTLIVPYYRNVKMLREQVEEWHLYPNQIRIVVVDDGSPEPAVDVIRSVVDPDLFYDRLEVYRIGVDIPWNRGGARNLGTKMAKTEWIVHVDIDHLLPHGCAARLLTEEVETRHWYRFNRFRRGKADETRRKDKIDDDVEFGLIHPHVDSYLCTKSMYWRAGGYDEDYSGCLGGGSPFLKLLERKGGQPKMLSKNTFLCVYTRSVVDDASDFSLSRDTGEYSRRRKLKESTNNTKPANPIRFPWQRVL
jgi:glycosyltransferase involved in cell wall biosynthesis